MNNKKMRPLSTESTKKKPAKLQPKWWLVIIIAALLLGYFASVQNNTIVEDNSTSSTSMQSTIEQTENIQSDATPVDDIDNEAELNEPASVENTDLTSMTNSETSDAKAILNAPLPETDSLAKEEIDRLADEKQRFAEQEKLAAEQLAMNKKLTDLKAEEIELLEKQIAKLEAETDSTANTK